MTILVGILCKDGVIIGADGSATFGAGQQPTIEQRTQKIDVIDGHVVIAGTGEIGLGQRFTQIVGEKFREGQFRKNPAVHMMTHLSNAVLQNFQLTGIPASGIPYGALLAFLAHGQLHLCEFQLHNMRPELKTEKLWYCSMGSGQMIVDPFLGLMREVYWDTGLPSRQDATFAVMWALRHAIDCNPGGINEPIQIAELTIDNGKPAPRLLTEDELQEHRENVDDAIKHLRAYRGKLKGEVDGSPEVPKPAHAADAVAARPEPTKP